MLTIKALNLCKLALFSLANTHNNNLEEKQESFPKNDEMNSLQITVIDCGGCTWQGFGRREAVTPREPTLEQLCWQDLWPQRGPTLEQFVQNCSLWDGLTLERFLEDSLPWEGLHVTQEKYEEKEMASWATQRKEVEKSGMKLSLWGPERCL